MRYVDFEYDGQKLSDFGCIIGYIDSSSGTQDVNIGSDITFNTVKNNHSSIHYVTSSTYDNTYSITFDIVKNPCVNNNDLFMTTLETRRLIKWLNRRDYHKFKLFNENFDLSDMYYYGSFNIVEKRFGTNIIGLSLTFTSSSPYAFGDNVKLEFSVDKDEEFILYGDSDEFTTIFPTIQIKCLSNTSDDGLVLTNKTTSTSVIIKGCSDGETIIIDGEYKIITTDDEIHKITIASDFNYEYLDILVDDYSVENVYSCNIPCELTISYSPIRKVGAF